MSKYHYFTGPCKWAKVVKPDEYKGVERWTIDVYLTKADIKEIKDLGLSLKVREDDDGKFVKFSREKEKEIKGEVKKFDPPKLFDTDGKTELADVAIGNGSTVTAKISVFNTAKGPGHRLEAIRVDNLIKFEPEEQDNNGEF